MKSSFGGTIVRVVGPGANAAKRAKVNDPPATSTQKRQGCFRYEEWTAHIAGKNRVPPLDCEIVKAHGLVISCIVDQDIQTAQLGDCFFHGLAHATCIGNIAAQRYCTYP